MSRDYVLISPCRDEAEYIEFTLKSVVTQSIPPKLWLIVDDGSTDATPEIIKKYQQQYDFIKVLPKPDRGERKVGPGVIEAFYFGYDTLNIDDFDYLCKLDMDLELPPRYFEILMERMEAEPRLGTCSGKPCEKNAETGQLTPEKRGDETSVGMSKFYRTSCFKDIGGFVHEVMWDGIDSHKCRQLGWISCAYNDLELQFAHLRQMGSSQKGIYTGRIRHGFGQYFMGTGLLYMLASTLYRLNEKPVVLGSLASLWGYLTSLFSGKARLNDPELRKFINHYQWACLIKGKAKATEQLNHQQQQVWESRMVANVKGGS